MACGEKRHPHTRNQPSIIKYGSYHVISAPCFWLVRRTKKRDLWDQSGHSDVSGTLLFHSQKVTLQRAHLFIEHLNVLYRLVGSNSKLRVPSFNKKQQVQTTPNNSMKISKTIGSWLLNCKFQDPRLLPPNEVGSLNHWRGSRLFSYIMVGVPPRPTPLAIDKVNFLSWPYIW